MTFRFAESNDYEPTASLDAKELLNSNPILSPRTHFKLSELVNSKKIDWIADSYIAYFNELAEKAKKEKKSLQIKVLFHNDADGVVAAKVSETFFLIYESILGVNFNIIFEARPAYDCSIGDKKNIDAVFVLDLFWSQMVEGVDFAIDHHSLGSENEKRFSNINPKLVNLEQVEFKGSTKFMPASALAALLFDYILRKQKVKKGLLALSSTICLNNLLDGAFLGDHSYPHDATQMGFQIQNEEIAEAIQFITESGSEGLGFFLNPNISLSDIRSLYHEIRPQYNQIIHDTIQTLKETENPYMAGILFPETRTRLQSNTFEANILTKVLNACSQFEEKNREIHERRVIVFGTPVSHKGKSIYKFSLRFDGEKEIFSLKDVEESLKNALSGKFGIRNVEGGGHEGALSLRVSVEKNTFENESALQNLGEEILALMNEIITRTRICIYPRKTFFDCTEVNV